ncbi:MAG: hypothetical protein ACI3YC_07935 [Alloprevotella sp.]
MKFIPSFLVLALMGGSALLVSCSEDLENEKYQSVPPTVADIEFKSLGADPATVRVGDKFVITVKQSAFGRLLDKTKYTWSLNRADCFTQVSKNPQEVIYSSYEFADPTDTLVALQAGTFKVAFKGEYRTYGQTVNWAQAYGTGYTTNFSDNNGKVSYQLLGSGVTKFIVNAEKSFEVWASAD